MPKHRFQSVTHGRSRVLPPGSSSERYETKRALPARFVPMRGSKHSTSRPGMSTAGSLVLAFLLVFLLPACTPLAFEPKPLESPSQSDTVKSAEKDGVRVAAAILTDAQAQQHFGLDLASKQLQAIWVRIENDSPQRLWFLLAALDPDYYSANEAAFLFSESLSPEERIRVANFFTSQAPKQMIEPGTVSEGYVLGRRTEGGRYVNVELAGHEKLLRFGFAIPVADGNFDFEELTPRQIYGDKERPDLSPDELRAALRALPCCTLDASGERLGDPLNIAIVGNFEELMTALARSGWSFTHRISPGTVARLVEATVAGDPYYVAPVSPLYVFGRAQDMAFQRARSWITQRNHMRLWLAPFRFQERSVWVGQISRDIGIKLTSKSPTLTTHVIDPYVDEAREYLLQTLLHHHGVEQFGFLAGVGESTQKEPRSNLTDDPYYTDGLRLVVVLAEAPTPPHRARNFHWKELY